MPFLSTFNGSFCSGRRSNSSGFGLFSRNKIIAHYQPSDLNSYSGTGEVFTDLTNNHYNASIYGSPVFENDHFNMEPGDYISTPDIKNHIGGQQAHTVEVWCYPTGDGVLVQYCGQPNPNVNYNYSVIEIVNGQINFGLWNQSGISSSGPAGNINLNSWNQIVISYDGEYIRGFINGSKVTKTAVVWDPPADSFGAESFPAQMHVVFGAATINNQGSGIDFNGSIGIIRIYNRKLNRSAIIQNYTKDKNTHTIPSFTPDPSHAYKNSAP